MLGLPERFDVDVSVLERAYFEHSRELHPDRFATAPANERVVALSRSRALNDAYQTLKKPVPRAEYLLVRHGVSITDNERLDPAFLMEILELREELAEARQAGKLADVERLHGVMAARRATAVAALTPLFATVEAGGEARPPALASIKTQLITLRYLDRYLEECDAALDQD